MTTSQAVNTLILSGALIALLTYILANIQPSGRHKGKIRTAWRVHGKLNSIATEKGADADRSWFLTYLRKIDPFVFEELTLICLREQGYTTRRNRRYTGDGGVDGRAWKGGALHLVQCKRYTGYIQKTDVEQLEELCRRKNCRGLFVHTGRTGQGSREAHSDRVEIISGDRLYDLIIQKKTNGT